MVHKKQVLRTEEKFKEELSEEQKTYSISKDTVLHIEESKNYLITIEESCSLILIGNSAVVSQLDINIKQGVVCSLIEVMDHPDLKFLKQINMKKEGVCRHLQFIFNVRFSKTCSTLQEKSFYEVYAGYQIENASSCFVNEARLEEQTSHALLQIKGTAHKGAKVISDGLIFIDQNAPQSEGHQILSGLLLDDLSSIASEPILEINNSNVKCSHGASITQIKDEVLYYTQSRGLSKEEAVQLIVNSIFDELIAQLSDTERTLLKNNKALERKIFKELVL